MKFILFCSHFLSVCYKCKIGFKCCKKIFGRCVFKCPKFKSCCKRITDPRCIAKNKGCYALKKTLEGTLRGVTKTLDFSKKKLDGAKAILSAAQGVINKAKNSLDGVVAALEQVKNAYRVGVSAIDALARFTQSKIIGIREIYFKVGLSVANGGKFKVRIECVLMGRSYKLTLDFDTRDVLSFAKKLAERALSGLSKFIG